MEFSGGIFPTKIVFSASNISFLNRTTGRCSVPSFTNADFAANETSFYAFSTSFSLHDYVAFLYCDSISHSHIILSGRCHISNCYYNNSASHLCTTWGTLASYSNIFCSTLKSDITVNYATHKDFLKLPMTHLNAADSPTKLCIEFSSGNTVDLETKGICCSCIPSKDLSNSHTPP